MQTKISNLQEFELTEQEELQGKLLNILQAAHIQNLRVALINQKLALRPELNVNNNDPTYWQLEAHLRGQIEILDQLLTDSSEASVALQNNLNQSK